MTILVDPMTILVDPQKSLQEMPCEVMPGFVKRLRFLFCPRHDEDSKVQYGLVGPYDIDVYVECPQNQRQFLGRGNLVLSNTTGDPVASWVTHKPDPSLPTWDIRVEVPASVIAEIDAARRPQGATPVKFVFDWRVWAKRCVDEKCQDPAIQLVKQFIPPSTQSLPIVTLEPTQWFAVTRAYGFPSRRLIELNFPAVDRTRWLRAAQALEQADHEFDSRGDEPTLAFCEQALDHVFGTSAIKGDKDLISTQLNDLGLTDPARLKTTAGVVNGIVTFVRKGKHGVTGPPNPEFDPSSGDAELGLLMTKAILGFLSRLRPNPQQVP